MATDYAQWSRFNLDEELSRVDRNEKRHELNKARSISESSFLKSESINAEVISSRAVVNRLLKKLGCRLRDRNRYRNNSLHFPTSTNQTQKVMLAEQRVFFLRSAIESRDKGHEALSKKAFDTASSLFEKGLHLAVSAGAHHAPIEHVHLRIDNNTASLLAEERARTRKRKLEKQALCAVHGKSKKQHAQAQCCTCGATHQLFGVKISPSEQRVVDLIAETCLIGSARSQLRCGNVVSSIEKLSAVLRINRKHVEALLLRGEAFAHLSCWPLAWQHLERAKACDISDDDGDVQFIDDIRATEKLIERLRCKDRNSFQWNEEENENHFENNFEDIQSISTDNCSVVQLFKRASIVKREAYFRTASDLYCKIVQLEKMNRNYRVIAHLNAAECCARRDTRSLLLSAEQHCNHAIAEAAQIGPVTVAFARLTLVRVLASNNELKRALCEFPVEFVREKSYNFSSSKIRIDNYLIDFENEETKKKVILELNQFYQQLLFKCSKLGITVEKPIGSPTATKNTLLLSAATIGCALGIALASYL
eukprot:g1421.t1